MACAVTKKPDETLDEIIKVGARVLHEGAAVNFQLYMQAVKVKLPNSFQSGRMVGSLQYSAQLREYPFTNSFEPHTFEEFCSKLWKATGKNVYLYRDVFAAAIERLTDTT